jgi:DnaK suppressor protein
MKTAPRPTPRRPRICAGTEPQVTNSVAGLGVDPHWAWHYRTLSHLRDRILAAHQEHVAEVASPPEMVGYESPDTAREELDRDILWAELGAENNRLHEIDDALNRIRAGTYGICEVDGDPIAATRLRAIPWTRFCHAAAEAAEKRRHDAACAST